MVRAVPAPAYTESALTRDPLLRARSAIGEARPLALDLFLGRPGAEAALARWVRTHPGAARDDRAGAWLLICEERQRRTRYGAALGACRRAEALSPGSTGNFIGLLAPLRDLPPLRWDRAGLEVPLIRDGEGTRRVWVSRGPARVEAVVDSGAEVAIVMASVAARLGARPLRSSRPPSIGTPTTPVAGSPAVIDRLEIGGAHLLNLPVIVLPDAQLTFADGSTLPLVLSLPALTAAGKAAFLRHGSVLALGNAVPALPAAPVQLYWDPMGVGFEAAFAHGSRAVHLDTGSVRTYLYPTAASSLGPDEAATRQPFDRSIAGLGGERREHAFRYAGVTVGVGGQLWRVAPMEMAPADDGGAAARIGAGIMDRFETIVLDFRQMRMRVR